MAGAPSWLPAPLTYTGNWDDFLRETYSVFENDFKSYPRPTFTGLAIFHDKRVIDSDKEEGFWHLASRIDRKTGQRLPDKERMQRIPWVKAIIENAHDESVTVFDYLEGSRKTRTYLWLRNQDYVVILEKKRNVALLVTAYIIDNDYTRRKLERKSQAKST